MTKATAVHVRGVEGLRVLHEGFTWLAPPTRPSRAGGHEVWRDRACPQHDEGDRGVFTLHPLAHRALAVMMCGG